VTRRPETQRWTAVAAVALVLGPGARTGFAPGTSGTPWLTGYDPTTGTWAVVGVIGGFQEGGDTHDVSYSPYFGPAVEHLYGQARLSR
jgi:hypothetical protein